MQAENILCTSFPPLASANARVLILGSMPGVESLRQQQYYAHPRNAFWPIMAHLFDLKPDWNYQQRCQQLVARRVAVWDVLKACQRPGSLDQHIEPASMEANDFNQFLAAHAQISHIFFNGSKAEQVFQRHIQPALEQRFRNIPTSRLPSTSPAHAAMNLEQKTAAWQQVRQALEQD